MVVVGRVFVCVVVKITLILIVHHRALTEFIYFDYVLESIYCDDNFRLKIPCRTNTMDDYYDLK